MDDDQELHAAFRLPETFAESGDAVEGNPYAERFVRWIKEGAWNAPGRRLHDHVALGRHQR